MKKIAEWISWISLVALTLPSILFLAGVMNLDQVKLVMLIATIVWFVSATPWMWQQE